MKNDTKYLLCIGAHFLTMLLGLLILVNRYDFLFSNAFLYFGLLIFLFSVLEIFRSSLRSTKLKLIICIIYCTSILAIALVSGIHAHNVNQYGPLVSDSIQAVYQTDLKEAISYVRKFVGPGVLLFSAGWFLFMAFSYVPILKIKPVNYGNLQRLFLLGLFGLLGAIVVFYNSSDIRLLYREAKAYHQSIISYKSSRLKLAEKYKDQIFETDFQGNIIVIIGESTSRHHLGIYQYFRDTTPLLSEIEDDLIIFDNVISSHSHTVPSLTDALMLNSRDILLDPHNILDIITIAKSAGFYSAWLSNQNAIGIWNNLVTAIASEADFIKYHDPSIGTEFLRSVYDDVLIDSLIQLLTNHSQKRRLIFLHLMATHFPYCTLVPDDFEASNKEFDVPMSKAIYGELLSRQIVGNNPNSIISKYEEYLDCYDLSIRYVDYLLSRTLQYLDDQNEPTIIIYFADHGEAPLIASGHDSRMHSHFHIEIPFLIWANNAYKQQYGNEYERIISGKDYPISLVDFSFALSDLTQIKGIDQQNNRSFFSPNYKIFPRTVINRKVGYDVFSDGGDYVEKTNALLETIKTNYESDAYRKVWAHRVNSMGAMLEAKPFFSGVELDIVFDESKELFFVYHPPVKNVGLDLNTFFRQDNGSLLYWFDWKNASLKNIRSAMNRLTQLDENYFLKKRVIIETDQSFSKISDLAQQEWHTSYYLPTNEVLNSIKEGDTHQKELLAKTIIDKVIHGKFSAISFDVRLYGFFDEFLREFIKRFNLDVYTWDTRLRSDQYKSIEKMEKYLKDDDIDVILINFPSVFDR